jgi:hypothetical protein
MLLLDGALLTRVHLAMWREADSGGKKHPPVKRGA